MLEITAFDDLWVVALGLFGIHLVLVGYLAYRSGYALRLLGVLVALSELGYMIDSVLSPGPWTSIGAFTFLGEFLLALWLVTPSAHETGPPLPSSRANRPSPASCRRVV